MATAANRRGERRDEERVARDYGLGRQTGGECSDRSACGLLMCSRAPGIFDQGLPHVAAFFYRACVSSFSRDCPVAIPISAGRHHHPGWFQEGTHRRHRGPAAARCSSSACGRSRPSGSSTGRRRMRGWTRPRRRRRRTRGRATAGYRLRSHSGRSIRRAGLWTGWCGGSRRRRPRSRVGGAWPRGSGDDSVWGGCGCRRRGVCCQQCVLAVCVLLAVPRASPKRQLHCMACSCKAEVD